METLSPHLLCFYCVSLTRRQTHHDIDQFARYDDHLADLLAVLFGNHFFACQRQLLYLRVRRTRRPLSGGRAACR